MKRITVCLILLLAFSLSACGKKAAPTPTPTPTPPAGNTTSGGGATSVNAEAIYKQSCISCHGDNLQGGVGPNLQKVGAKYQKDQIVTILTNGRGAMPSFKGKLSDTEIGAMADWLSTHK